MAADDPVNEQPGPVAAVPPLPLTLQVPPGAAAPEEPPRVKVTEPPLPPLQKHGVRLAWGVMGLIGIFGLILIALVGVNEFISPPKEVAAVAGLIEKTAEAYARAASGPDALKQANDLLTRLAESRRASRDFWTAFSQFLLLNLLLPVLTAVLGYVFGTIRKDNDAGASPDQADGSGT